MNPVSFVCPKTLQEIDAGIDVDCASLRHVQPITIRLLCPHCRQPHVWKIADGLLKPPRVA
jgi:hypothetical protein